MKLEDMTTEQLQEYYEKQKIIHEIRRKRNVRILLIVAAIAILALVAVFIVSVIQIHTNATNFWNEITDAFNSAMNELDQPYLYD